jgi:transmembrane sensor
MVIADPALGAIKVSASLRSDNVEGFIRLLEAGFGVQAEYRGATVMLRRAPRPAR